MALRDFWISVRTAARLFGAEEIGDSPRLTSGAIVFSLGGATLWLTPGVVSGFDEADFTFLPDDERAELVGLVKDFRAVTETVNPRSPAPDDAVARGSTLLRQIIQLLDFERYVDAEAYRLGKLIEHELDSDRRSELVELRFKTGLDHSGDPALWISAFLGDEASATDEKFLEAARRLRQHLESVARKVAPDRWPYLSFRSMAEEAEPLETS